MDTRHPNYEILNLVGYGLAKFDNSLIGQFGFKTKQAFYNYIVAIGIADTVGTVKNRQDLFDPFFSNDRKGWWQKGDTYIHRKILIDNLFGDLNVNDYAKILKLYIAEKSPAIIDKPIFISPILKSKYKQLQITGLEAEVYFLHNYNEVSIFKGGKIEDARLFGDGYDFQIEIASKFYLAEVKGVREKSGSIRITQNEFLKAQEYENDYILSVVYNMDDIPKISTIADPLKTLKFVKKDNVSKQINYHSENIRW